MTEDQQDYLRQLDKNFAELEGVVSSAAAELSVQVMTDLTMQYLVKAVANEQRVGLLRDALLEARAASSTGEVAAIAERAFLTDDALADVVRIVLKEAMSAA